MYFNQLSPLSQYTNKPVIRVSKYSTTLVYISHFFVGTNSPSLLYLSSVVIKFIFNILKCNLRDQVQLNILQFNWPPTEFMLKYYNMYP